MITDQAEREQAADPSRSYIVSAPAGSGKTGLLVQRYLRLLSTVESPEAVVAMTFTRKAAAELKERIHDALLQGAEEPQPDLDEYSSRTRAFALDALKQDARHGWNLLADAGRLQLQTIDSLCATLARQMPVLSGFSGSVQVVEDSTELYRLAASETLRRLAEGDNESRSLLTRLGIYFDSDFNCLTDQIVSMLAHRDQWQFSHQNVEAEARDFSLLLSAAELVLRDIFRDGNKVDFTAITEAAIAVLGSPDQPTDVLYGLDYRIQHLLVDEFQDTSLAQYRLINALTAQWSEGDGHTLFLVGDPMQSIYRFRGAEVSLFLQTWKDESLKSVRLHRLALTTNFRSTPQILEWVAEQFEPMLSGGGPDSVEFRPAYAARETVGLKPQWSAYINGQGTEEATLVADLASAACKNGTVAILVRNRGHLSEILPALRSRNIDYEAVEIDQLGERQHILDLVSVARALLHVGDRASWLACLRAPWCGLPLSDLSSLVEGERFRSVLELLKDPDKIASVASENRLRLLRVAEILSSAVAQAGRIPLRRLVEDTWLLLGGPALLQEAYQAEDIQTCLGLLKTLDEGGVISDFSQLNSRLAALFAQPASKANSVQVMTIFKAKGLEFDTVILPRMEGAARAQERELLIWDEAVDATGETVLAVAPQPRKGADDALYKSIRQSQRNKDNEELKRLLYVACTRAKNCLHLIGSAKLKKDGSLGTPASGTFLNLLWPAAQEVFAGALRRSARQFSFSFAEADEVHCVSDPQTVLHRLPSGWQLPRFSRWAKWQPALQPATASARKVTYEWVSDTARHVGTLVHEFLKRAASSAVAGPSIENFQTELWRPLIKSELLRLGVDSDEELAATDRVVRALTATFQSERGRWILGRHPEARSEWAIGGRIGSALISGVIDRAFRDEEGRFWIIDFKTGEHLGAHRNRFLDNEQERYRAQLESYAALLNRMVEGPVHLGLYFPLLDGWREWQFAGEGLPVAHYTGS